MTAMLPIRTGEAAAAPAGSPWRRHLQALGLAWAAILLLFHRDAAHMADIWWNASTYNHCLLIPPIIFWLVWQRREGLAHLTPAPWAPGLLLVGAGAFGWLLGDAGGVALARHAGLVLMLQGAVIACLGQAAARALAFPIFYALFLIPAGEEIVPLMQHVTAHICMFLLGLAGIPAHLEGIFISTPDGYFEVAEACAGVKFLIAMIAYGALVANVCFHSWKRRAAFMIASAVIPILANGVRAFGTVYVAHLTSVEFAVGFDHVVYGGIFFGIVIALMMAAGWPFFDRKVSDPWFDPAALPHRPRGRLRPVTAALLAIVAFPLLWSAGIAAAGERAAPAELALPDVPGWERVPGDPGRPWQPRYAGADLVRIGHYRDSQGREVDLAVAVFARQERGREMVAYGQGAAPPESGWAWISGAAQPPGGRAERIGSHGTVREVLTFYRVGRILTGSGVAVKLETMKTRLFGGPQRAVAVLVSAEAPGTGLSARPAIDSFVAALGPVDALADRAAGL
ncbi:MAG: exosortase A [Allosphingosinicella sp.]|uniref:exosortase A n=1 Tax=Allosphingosinicella sp. TaxID=2823234 RepID=UPI00395C043D